MCLYMSVPQWLSLQNIVKIINQKISQTFDLYIMSFYMRYCSNKTQQHSQLEPLHPMNNSNILMKNEHFLKNHKFKEKLENSNGIEWLTMHFRFQSNKQQNDMNELCLKEETESPAGRTLGGNMEQENESINQQHCPSPPHHHHHQQHQPQYETAECCLNNHQYHFSNSNHNQSQFSKPYCQYYSQYRHCNERLEKQHVEADPCEEQLEKQQYCAQHERLLYEQHKELQIVKQQQEEAQPYNQQCPKHQKYFNDRCDEQENQQQQHCNQQQLQSYSDAMQNNIQYNQIHNQLHNKPQFYYHTDTHFVDTVAQSNILHQNTSNHHHHQQQQQHHNLDHQQQQTCQQYHHLFNYNYDDLIMDKFKILPLHI